MPKKLTIEQLIVRATSIHKTKYDYSNVEFKNVNTKININCLTCNNTFSITPKKLLIGQGCKKCNTKNKIIKTTKSQSNFIKEAIKVHGANKFDYSLVNYINSNIKIKIKCIKCSTTFEQSPNSHLQGHGCKKCVKNKNSQFLRFTKEQFIQSANKIHKYKYDYSKVEYINARTKVKIICKKHGEFEQFPTNHTRGAECNKCVGNILKSTEQFTKEANLIHNNLYNYTYSNYVNNKTKIDIFCEKHGIFKQSPSQHLCGAGCPNCKLSRGENKIKNFLIHEKISFISQKKFKNCKNINRLSFDFYLPDYNLCIEFDGLQHFNSIKHFGGQKQFEKRQFLDNIKTEYCKKNNIQLLRIPYNKIQLIDDILQNELKQTI